MCEFCQGNKPIYENEIEGVKITAAIKNNQVIGQVHIPLFGQHSDKLNIKFCPMCGGKLS